MNILSITGHLVLWAPSPPGLHLGLGIGNGSGKISSGSSIVIFSDASYNSQAEGSWKGSNLTTEAFVGYRLHLAPALGLQFRGGYRFRKLGPFDGSIRSPQFGYAEGPYVNNEGESVEFDFSGIHLTAGLTIVLGPPRDKVK